MYAIIDDGGHQYKVEPGQIVRMELREGEPGSTLTFNKICAIGGDSLRLGTPHVPQATVVATVVKHVQGPKVVAFTYRRRKDSRRKVGHRQKYTEVRVDSING